MPRVHSRLYAVSAARIITEHTRTVNRVQFHATEPTLLLSGSQDGTMKMWVCVSVLASPNVLLCCHGL